ncbi:DMT family transporter [Sphingomonas rhizophila]|uniref:DMT family transporter n=1 Tax=Sphingomonas rhizophila TaxID=2071607 RepID=A0A7G9SC76_9SPHN|nr:DMT family transporter [Sphingomonas rhizophila]QNN65451.1 DMT family transporter [Sphingomonas rhizophila]
MPVAPLSTDRPVAQRQLAGMALRLLTAALLSAMFAMIKLAGQRGVHVVESLFWRQVGSAVCATAWVAIGPGFASLRTRRVRAHVERMALGLVTMALNFLAFMMLPLAEATAIFFSAPIFSTLLAATMLSEPTGRWRWGAVIAGFLGVLVIVRPGGADLPLSGASVALVAALLTASVTIVIRRLSATEAAATTVFWFATSSLVPLGLLMLFFGQVHDATTMALFAGIALTGGLAQLALTGALRLAPVALVMPMDYTGLIWAALLGLLIFGEWPAPVTWIGALIVIASGLVILWREQRLHRRAAPVTDS